MTISFEYNSYLEDPMKNFSDSVRISFDALQDFQFKPLDPSVLEKSLTGKLEPSIFGKLKLFQHKEPKKQDNEALLDANDHYNLNFIYNVLRRHFEARNRNYAVSVNHKSSPRDVCKTLSAERDSDTINTHVSLVQDEEVFEKTSFLRSETEVLAGRLVSEYTAKNHIPVFYDTKELLHQQEPETMIRDEVLIKHDNLLLPDFSASSYFQIPYGRDVSGHVSTSASIVASNFLGMDTISTYPEGENSRVGTRKGLVNVVDATESIKAYLNQLQILQHVHFTHTAHAQVFKSTHSYSHLRALGYSLHGSMSRNIIEAYTSRFTACALGSSYLAATQRKYWVLKAVEQKPHLFTDMRCVVTHISRDIELGSVSEDNSHPQSESDLPPHQLFDQSSWPSSECQAVRAYCEELGIEVELLVGREREVMVGSELTASAVLHVDASSGIILMG
ncbi:hypothetical protein JCM33374_g4341 [Metschnikowia sp. JCM 33374]|nr:hypothetical protein JCM33374_g4341 [Metschnikowia sp. JCM 33374]